MSGRTRARAAHRRRRRVESHRRGGDRKSCARRSSHAPSCTRSTTSGTSAGAVREQEAERARTSRSRHVASVRFLARRSRVLLRTRGARRALRRGGRRARLGDRQLARVSCARGRAAGGGRRQSGSVLAGIGARGLVALPGSASVALATALAPLHALAGLERASTWRPTRRSRAAAARRWMSSPARPWRC